MYGTKNLCLGPFAFGTYYIECIIRVNDYCVRYDLTDLLIVVKLLYRPIFLPYPLEYLIFAVVRKLRSPYVKPSAIEVLSSLH